MLRALYLALVFAPLPAATQDFDARHRQDLTANPPDLQFRISTSAPGPFHMGERIVLNLEFRSAVPDKYLLDRGTRLLQSTEEFCFDRSGAADLYRDLSWRELRDAPYLAGAPPLNVTTRIQLTMNNSVRFDAPGRYRLYVRSHRVYRERAPEEAGDEPTALVSLVSNVIEFEILPPDPEWEAARLAAARGPSADPDPDSVVYLATPAMVDLLLEQTRRSGIDPLPLPLLAARDRTHVARAVDRWLATDEAPLSRTALWLRALFLLAAEDPLPPLPHWTVQARDPRIREQVRATAAAREKRLNEILRQEAERLVPVAASHPPETRDASLKTLATFAPAAGRAAGLLPPPGYGMSRDQLQTRFLELPDGEQQELLAQHWDRIRGPEMIPALLRLDTPAALRRVLELAPEAGLHLLREKLIAGRSEYFDLADRHLPPGAVPEADEVFAAHLDGELPAYLHYIARFASPALAPKLRAVHEARGQNDLEARFAAYFTRAFPNDLSFLRRAMANPELPMFASLLSEVARQVWTPALEAQVLVWMRDPDARIAASAARALRLRGSPETEFWLWLRLEDWRDAWRDRTAALRGHPITGGGREDEVQLGEALFEALSEAKSWPLDPPRRARLAALCLDRRCRERWSSHAAAPLELAASNGEFTAGGYTARSLAELQQKLLQYPSGTSFRWCDREREYGDPLSPGLREETLRKLAAFAAQHGLRLEGCPGGGTFRDPPERRW